VWRWFFFTRRHPEKKEYPNFWETTGGSTHAKESSKAGAVRELYEETGICVKESELTFLGTKKEKSAFVDTFIVRQNVDLKDMLMQEGETVDAQWVTYDRLNEMMNKNLIVPLAVERLKRLLNKFIIYVNGEL